MGNVVQLLLQTVDGVTKPNAKIGRSLRRLSGDVAKTDRELSGLAGQRKAVKRLRELGRTLIEEREQLRKARQALKQHQAALTANGKPSEKLIATHRRMAAGVVALERKLERKTGELRKQQGVLRSAGLQTNHLAAADRELTQREAKLTEQLKRKRLELEKQQGTYRRAQEAQKRFDKRMSRAGNATIVGHGAAAVVRGAGNIFMAPYKGALDYLGALEDIGITAGLNIKQQKLLGKQTRATARQTNQSVGDLLEAQQILIERGLTAGQANSARSDIATVATATKSAAQEIAKTSGALIDNLGVLPKALKSTFDGLSFLGKQGGFELRDMAQFFPELTGGLDALGFKDSRAAFSLGAALQVARTQAGSSAEAANNTKNFLQKLTAPRTIKNFEKFGVDIKSELSAALADGADPLEFMLSRIRDLAGDVQSVEGQSIIGELFGDMQVLSFLKPALANFDEFVRLKKEAASSSGLIDADFANRMKSEMATARAFGLAWNDLKRSVGIGLLPVLTPAIQGLTKLVNGFTRFAENNPKTMTGLLGIGAGLVAFTGIVAAVAIPMGTLLGGLAILGMAKSKFGGGLKGLFSIFGGGSKLLAGFAGSVLPKVIKGLKLFTTVFRASPLGLAVTGATLLGGYLLKRGKGDGSAGAVSGAAPKTVTRRQVRAATAAGQGVQAVVNMNGDVVVNLGANAGHGTELEANVEAAVRAALRKVKSETEASLRSSLADIEPARAF